MSHICRLLAAATAAALLSAAASAHPGERDRLDACKAMVARDSRAQAAVSHTPGNAQLAKCRQMIWEWTQRDARMSVDENGRPLR